MKFGLIILKLTLITLLLQCNYQKEPSRYPDDFCFQIVGANYTYNSKDQVFTRRYIKKDTSILVEVNEAELKLIFELVSDMEFHNFPKEFEQAKYGTFVHPSTRISLEIGYNGKHTKCVNDSGYPTIEQERPKKFGELESTIRKILTSKSQVSMLAETDIISL